jgi:DNA-directed RNA polymerase specialized sigma24 family protein
VGWEALEECYEKHSEALVRLAASMIGAADAEDVVATVVASLLDGPDRDVQDWRAYLYRSVVNEARRHWRGTDRRRRRELLVSAWSRHGDGPAATAAVAGALATLSPQQRAVVHLTYWEDLAPHAVAARLGVSDGTVRRQLARARRRLREVLDDRR